MTNPIFRALCAELVALDGHCVVDCTEEWADAMNRARAVLARWGTPTNTINQEDYDRG